MLKWFIEKFESDVEELRQLRAFRAEVGPQLQQLAQAIANEPEAKAGPNGPLIPTVLAILARQKLELKEAFSPVNGTISDRLKQGQE